jgi:hypothetical protein
LIYYHYKEHIPLILINLTPIIPLSLRRRGGKTLERGRSPLSYLHSPFPFVRGRGIQGDRVGTIITGNSKLSACGLLSTKCKQNPFFDIGATQCYHGIY